MVSEVEVYLSVNCAALNANYALIAQLVRSAPMPMPVGDDEKLVRNVSMSTSVNS